MNIKLIRNLTIWATIFSAVGVVISFGFMLTYLIEGTVYSYVFGLSTISMGLGIGMLKDKNFLIRCEVKAKNE